MIGYSDSTFSSPLCAPGSPAPASSPAVEPHRLQVLDKRGASTQLTPVWEHVVRTQSVPKDVNLDDIFLALRDRLNDPEREVRQHALRVLVDIIPVMDDTLDQRMQILLSELVGNLGHPGPAVRKGALDSLKAYLKHSSNADNILRNIVSKGVEHYLDNQLQSDVVVGIILSLPSLIFPGGTSDSVIEYVVRILITRLVQVTFQEVSLKSLSRIRNLIGPKGFNRILEATQPNTRREFELLCQVYDDYEWNDMNANIVQESRWNSDSDSAGVFSPDEAESSKPSKEERTESFDSERNVASGKVILETEIMFNSSTAVTMKILEEGDSKSVGASDSDDDNNDCVVKVLSDSENDDPYELRRRTPRRVRFGGEVVKMRTPDSDSNQLSDTDNDITITTSSVDSNNPVIEIKFLTDENENKKRPQQTKSLIPLPVAPIKHKPKARSHPSSPNRKIEIQPKTKLLYQSHPNLIRSHFFSEKQNKSKTLKPLKTKEKQNTKSPGNYVDISTSPIPIHREIEVLHNLTRSPSNSSITSGRRTPGLNESQQDENNLNIVNNNVDEVSPGVSAGPTNNENTKTTSDNTNQNQGLAEDSNKSSKPINTEMSATIFTDFSDNDSNESRTFSSFILKDSASEGVQSDSFIPTMNNGDCLTCSSSGSEGVQAENTWETSGIMDKQIVEDLNDKNDWRVRYRGFEALDAAIRSSNLLRNMTPYLGTFLHFLFNAERHPKLQKVVENVIKQILSENRYYNLDNYISQLGVGLSKMGAPAGIRLAIILMQKSSAKQFIQHLLEEPITTSKSAKTREGALQILLCATRMFPSTEFDSIEIAKRVTKITTDRKRRVRQAALDVLAVVGQIGNPSEIIEAVRTASVDMPEQEDLMAAVRARLSRRQLPIVEVDGSIVYASPGVGHGADVEWVAAGSGSLSPCSARSRRSVLDNTSRIGSSSERTVPVPETRKNVWGPRYMQDTPNYFNDSINSQDSVTWALVPVSDTDKSQGKSYENGQLWDLSRGCNHADVHYDGSAGERNSEDSYSNTSYKAQSFIFRDEELYFNQTTCPTCKRPFENRSEGPLRPVYLMQAHQVQNVRPRQAVQNAAYVDRGQRHKDGYNYSRGRSSSPSVKLMQINDSAKINRNQSLSPPGYNRRVVQEVYQGRAYPVIVSSNSTRSRESPARSNWHGDFQSAIPVPVGVEGKNRFRRFHHREAVGTLSQTQPLAAHHRSNSHLNVSSPTNSFGVSKSTSATPFSADKFSLSHDSGISHQASSGSESSEYYSPPSEPYSLAKPAVQNIAIQDTFEDSFDQPDHVPVSASQNRERFINIEESFSTSEFEEQDSKEHEEDLEESPEILRNQVFSKLEQEHVFGRTEPSFENKVPEKRLSKSHADLSQRKNVNRKSISSAPIAKQLKRIERKVPSDIVVKNIISSEAKMSQNYSTLASRTPINDAFESLNVNANLEVNKSITEAEHHLHNSSDNFTNLEQSNQNQTNYLNGNHTNNNSVIDESNIDDKLKHLDIRNQNYVQEQPKSEEVKCPEIVKRNSRTLPKQKTELRRRSSSIPMKGPSLFPDTLRNFPKPKEGYSEMIHQLESPEWETTMKGLQSLVRLLRHHPEMLETQMHTVCVLLGRHIKNLRSQVARAACHTATEMFQKHMKALEPELEEVANPLLQRTADTNKFLRADANAALDTMCANASVTKVVGVLGTRGATHHNAIVRCATARLLLGIVQRLSPQKIFQLPKETRDRVLLIGANFLTEGNLDTRKHAKSMFSELVSHPNFQRSLFEAVPGSTLRHITKIINSLK